MLFEEDLKKLGFQHPALAAPEHRYSGADKSETHNQDCLTYWLDKMGVSITFWKEQYANGLSEIEFMRKIDSACYQQMQDSINEIEAGEYS